MSSLLAEKKKSLGLTNLLLGARAGQMAPPPAHHHHQEKAYADFTHEQKEQEVGGASKRRLIRLIICCSLFYGIVFCFFTRRGGSEEVEGDRFQLFTSAVSKESLSTKNKEEKNYCLVRLLKLSALVPFRFA